MKKKLLAILLAVCMVVSMAPAALAADSVFTDVNAGDWFAEEVGYVYDNGLMNGVGNNKFDPNGYVTRAMMWTTLARLDDVDTTGSNPWWLEGQQWAMEEGISDGTMAEKNITREQLVTMLWRYAKYADMDVSAGEDTDLFAYTDAAAVSEWAVAAMQWACGAGIINGIGTTLQPQGYATRAQLAAILYRFTKEQTHTVTFMWNDGSMGIYATVEVENGKTVGTVSNPSRSGYSFAGWYTRDGVPFTSDTKVTEDVVVYAKWSEGASAIIHRHTYNAGDTEDGYHHCGTCSYKELCVPNVADGDAITCAVCGADYVVAAEASFELEGVTIESDGAGLQSYGDVTVKDVVMNAGSPADYAVIIRGGTAALENVDVNSAGGGVGAIGGAKVVFDGSGVAVDSTSTSGRYLFYAVDEGTEVTIKSGDFTFSKTLNQKRAYIYAGAGATVYVEGGNFGPASKRDGYAAGIMGDGTVVITGGTFGFDPTKWVAEGYYAAKDGSVWTVGKCESHVYKAEAGYHTCELCSVTEMCTPKVEDGDAVVCAVCGKDYIVAAEASFELEGVSVQADGAGLESYGTVTVKNVVMDAGSPSDYAVIVREGTATFENVDVNSAGGGVGATGGAKVVFDGSGVAVDSTSTSGRYLFYAVDEGTEVTIKSGDFTFSKTLNQKRAYIYAGAGATVYVEGGNFGPASKRDGYTAGIMGDGTVIITGGTFGFDPTNWVAPGYAATKSEDTWTVAPVMMKAPLRGNALTSAQITNDPEIPDVAQIGETGYDTLQDAFSAAVDGDVVTLIENLELDIEDSVQTATSGYSVMLAVEGKSITLDMNGKMIFVDHQSTAESNRIYAIIYVADGASLRVIGDGKIDVDVHDTTPRVAYMFWKRGESGTLTIESGYYHMDHSEDSVVYANDSDTTIVNGGTFILDTAGTGSNNGFPWIFSASGNGVQSILVNGGSYNIDITKQYWAEARLGEGLIVQERDGMYHVIQPVMYIEQSGEKVYFDTMTEAIAAAQDGDTIVLEKEISVDETAATEVGIAKLNSDIPTDQHVTLFNVSGKSITVDLNGQQIYADVTGLPAGTALAGIFSTSDGGQLTLQDSADTGVVEVKAGTVNVFAMIINLDHSDNSSKITIESGTYILDRSVSAMIDTRCNEGVVINGGTFKLGNVKDPGLKNGQAWTFNAKGQNTRHVIVTGGTFPADIQHQYYPFEVSMAKELALQYNAETGMYTVVPAVAYVNEQEFSGKWYTNEIGYATLAEALAAVEGPKTSWNGQVSEQEYVTPLSDDFDGIEFNENGTITITGDGTVLDLGGETLTFNTTNAITVKAKDVVINGTGGGITVTTPAGEKATIINVTEGASCTVNGGTYTANTSGAGASGTSQTKAFYAGKNATLNVNDATIIATDDNDGCVVGVNGGYSSTVLNLTDCDITVTSGDSLDNIGVQTWGKAVLKGCSVIAQANYIGANGAYTANSRGIYAKENAPLELYDCYVWGAHSGVTTLNSVYVDGGTYEGYGHGAFYLAGGSKTSYFYNATINWAPMRDGFEYDNVAGTNAAGMYISGASNVKAYFDNCSFNMNAANGEKWDNKICPYYAVVINNGNNSVYVSNCHIEYANNVAFRLHKTYADRYVYYGVGNTYDETNVASLITSGKESQLVETNESYAKNAQA